MTRIVQRICLVGICALLAAPAFGEQFISKFAWNDEKLIPADSWVYPALAQLAAEQRMVTLANSAPLSIAELKVHLEAIQPERLSPSGKRLYEQLTGYFATPYYGISSNLLTVGLKAQIAPYVTLPATGGEMARKWDYQERYWTQPQLVCIPMYLTAGNALMIETAWDWRQNYWAINEGTNPTNIPFAFGDDLNYLEFEWPKNAFVSAGIPLKDYATINLQAGKTGLNIGTTAMDSVILSDTFETDFYASASVFAPNIRYRMDVAQLEVNKYLYLHHVDFRPFKLFSFSLVEGTLVNAPFELRFLNPLMIMHSFNAAGTYDDYDAGQADKDAHQRHVSQYFAATVECVPVPNVRIYGLYAQNEIQAGSELNSESGRSVPNGLGTQWGVSCALPSRYQGGGFWLFGAEGLYTSPYCYLRHEPGASLIRGRENHTEGHEIIWSWIGSQYGPDSLAARCWFGYDMPGLWNARLTYRFLAHGENDTTIFTKWPKYKNGDAEQYAYYPSSHQGEGLRFADIAEAIAAARDMSLSGTLEYTHSLCVSGEWRCTDWLTVNSSFTYRLMLNAAHEQGTFLHGPVLTVGATIQVL